MNHLHQFFEITIWILPVYVVVSIILCSLYWMSNKANTRFKQKAERWIGLINTIFVFWFLAFTINEVVATQIEDFGFQPDFDSSTLATIISSVLFLVRISLKKFRKSPYSMMGISLIIVINLIIAYSNVTIIV